MIPDTALNSQKSQKTSLSRRLAKGVLSLLPANAPSRIYNTAINVPIARDILGAAVRSMIPEKIEAHGCTLFLDRQDIAVSGSLALSGFESFETSVFAQALEPGMTVLDIGAHIGYYALLAATKVGPNGRVIAYEPEPSNFALLSKNISVNNLKNVTPVNAAAADKAGTREFFIEKYNKGHHSFGKTGTAARSIKVRTEIPDDTLKAKGIQKIDVIKIDIEGAEPIALRGLANTIAENPDILIFTEFYPRSMTRLGESPDAFLKGFTAHGFRIWVIDETHKKLRPIKDVGAFMKDFPRGETFVNLLISRK